MNYNIRFDLVYRSQNNFDQINNTEHSSESAVALSQWPN